MTTGSVPKPLAGWRVLVPRGGPWGDSVAADLRAVGASPVVAAMINFAPAADASALERALHRLAAGEFDWVTITSATTVDVLSASRAVVPPRTRIAAVGETTAAALTAASYKMDLVPAEDNSAHGLLAEWEAATQGQVPLRILTLRSDIAKPLLTEGLRRIGHDVDSVVAYRTIGVTVPESVVADVRQGLVQAILVTSGSVAEQVQLQLGPIPESTLVAAIGPRTARDARDCGLRVDVVAEERTAAALIQAVVAVAASRVG
ncbi:uroporphyrinogen III synthase [Leifsonia xyli subsp. xyli]|uniref:Uroporphyrinogen-III synthase n=2 Tax=Leifsonia xyli subsp. xyli TaxID=59736 RepID=Q6AHF0_LEIXX|nr:uroporphyrinogen-III synthase [Leifsonia xyli]AAT88195.1 uroporphyrinogen-III synthase [Leifsonia xyli subsp. xyli str. CTCB07]ODA90925.1 uroporphyrinogen III synthase [Leifsonia xyli subsp. xyli]